MPGPEGGSAPTGATSMISCAAINC
jgi:hypothetical protein